MPLVPRALNILVRTQVHFERSRELESGVGSDGWTGGPIPEDISAQGWPKWKLQCWDTGWARGEVSES